MFGTGRDGAFEEPLNSSHLTRILDVCLLLCVFQSDVFYLLCCLGDSCNRTFRTDPFPEMTFSVFSDVRLVLCSLDFVSSNHLQKELSLGLIKFGKNFK